MSPIRPKCFFIALIGGWVVAIFLPSLVVAAAGLSPVAAGRNLAAATIEVADEVAPAAKIGFALLFALLLYARRRWNRVPPLPADILIGSAAMLVVLALLPLQWSRGFGIGLSASRFDPPLLAAYFLGGALAGLAFHLAEKRCLRRSYPDDSPSAE
ncbi:MAG TPA: hypothetical protein VGA98_11150 [Allosphingosinicella sp.]